MTTLALVAVAVLGAAAGILTAYLTATMRAASRALDADLTELNAQADAYRAQAHLVGKHIRPGGRGDCVLCGLRAEFSDGAL